MEVMLRKYGNSTVVVLPPGVLKDLGLCAGQAMSLSTSAEGEIILTKKQRYRLDDLIAQCNPKARVPEDIALWDRAAPMGKEEF